MSNADALPDDDDVAGAAESMLRLQRTFGPIFFPLLFFNFFCVARYNLSVKQLLPSAHATAYFAVGSAALAQDDPAAALLWSVVSFSSAFFFIFNGRQQDVRCGDSGGSGTARRPCVT